MPDRIVRILIVLVAVLLSVAACGDDAAPSSPAPNGGIALPGTAWAVLTVAGRPPVAGAVPTIQFSTDRVVGSGGCNHLGGSYQADLATGQIAFRELGMTAMGCLQPGVSDFETVFVQALGSATQVGIDEKGQLALRGPGGVIVLARVEHP